MTALSNPLLIKAVERCASWEDFAQRLSRMSEKEKGDVFEHLVRAYLLLDPEYATKLRKVWLLNEVPSALRKKLRLPPDDQGIDLIAETNTGEYWAIQCKYREDTSRPLPWREISTFTGLAFGVSQHIAFGLVCSTTERVTRVLKDQNRIGFCSLDVWQNLDQEFFKRLRQFLGRKPAKLVPLKPRPHQKRAIQDAREHFVAKKQKRGKLISPCGSGKSLTAYWIARDLGAKKILVAVPSLSLIRQTLKVWLRESLAHGDKVEWICVCSDESAGRVEQDDVAVLRQDLGAPCLTDPKEIASWLQRKKTGLSVVFTTYQSGEALGKAARQAKVSFDLGIMDEAHKTVGDGDKLFSHLLHDQNLPIRRRIFMTATERRYRGKGDTILSMDNAAIYGDTFHLLSFKRALEEKPPILCDYRIVTILVSRDEVADMVRKNIFLRPDKGRWNKEVEAEMLASLVALRKAMEKYPIRHAVSFHSSIQRAEIFKDHNEAYNRAFKKHQPVESFHVSGKTPTGTRARIVNEFAATQFGIITNARCLTEGVDVPGIDCVMFADPRRSAVDIVQAVGRALRPAEGKKMGYVIVPILHDADAKPDDIFASEEFQEILTTLRALAANDERIIEYFRSVSEGKQRSGGGSVVFDIDEKLAKRIDLEDFVREIDLKCWDRLAKLSWRPFEEARAFVHSINLKNRDQWREYCKGLITDKGTLPADIPANPNQIYASIGWKSLGDWLGTGTIATRHRAYLPFEEARAFVHSLELKNNKEWRRFTKGQMPEKGMLPADIPANPNQTYATEGWKGFGDWLGTGTIAPRLREYLPFTEARTFVRTLNLRSGIEWDKFCKGQMPEKGFLPANIPIAPHSLYGDSGWLGLGDWLGTNKIATHLREYLPFEEARSFVRLLKLKGQHEWREFCKGELTEKGLLPANIPAAPDRIYATEGWKGFGDWLGTGTIAPRDREYLPFEEAREFVRSLKLKNQKEWNAFCKGQLPEKGLLPANIPITPYTIYEKNGWKGLGDWIGTGTIAPRQREYLPFEEARAFVRSLKLKNQKEWRAFCKGELSEIGMLPADIPANPHNTYSTKGWKGYGNWLGTGAIATREVHYRPFAEARTFVHSLNLKSTSEWRLFCKGQMPEQGTLPSDIPANPNQTYAKSGWKGSGDWIGTNTVATFRRAYRPFDEAQAFARSLRLKNSDEWHKFCKGQMPEKGTIPTDIPANPNRTYATKGWKGYGDWLGTGTISPKLREYLPFGVARAFVHTLKLKSRNDWKIFCKGQMPQKGNLPVNIPAAPEHTYKSKGWKGYGDWLGKS
jgi:superfamily II DNA or RNA helicase